MDAEHLRVFRHTPVVSLNDAGLLGTQITEQMMQKARDIRVLLAPKATKRDLPQEVQRRIDVLLFKATDEYSSLTDDERRDFLALLRQHDLLEPTRTLIERPVDYQNMQMIIPGLYISCMMPAYSKKILLSESITHICVCFGARPPFADEFNYLVINVYDMSSEDIKIHFRKSIDFISKAREDPNTKVLIHCQAGISRSSTIAVAYLMHELGISANQALALVRTARPWINPNEGFARQLLDFECELFEAESPHGRRLKQAKLVELSSSSPSSSSESKDLVSAERLTSSEGEATLSL